MFVCSIRENQITQLPASIGQLRQLASLDCSYNQLEHLPAQLGECRQLVQLDLQHNKLIDLPPEIGNLTQLARLGLRYTNIFLLPSKYFYATRQFFCFKANNFYFVVHTFCLTNIFGAPLKIFFYRYNQLHTGNIPKSLSQCVNLEEFNIENNCVAALPEGLLASLDKITSITLSR